MRQHHPIRDWLWYFRSRYYIRQLDRLRTPVGQILYLSTHWAVPGFAPTMISFDESGVVVTNYSTKECYVFPQLPQVAQLRCVSAGYRDVMEKKYSLPGFVEVKPGDKVVDVGAYIGAWSLAAANKAASVFAFEPATLTFGALQRNICDQANIEARRAIVGNRTGRGRLQLSRDGTDNSVISPDRWATDDHEMVDMIRLDELDFIGNTINLVKVDAEGFEPEVVEGSAKIDVQKWAIDCSNERNGKSTVKEVTEILEDRGYEVEIDEPIVFARRETVDR